MLQGTFSTAGQGPPQRQSSKCRSVSGIEIPIQPSFQSFNSWLIFACSVLNCINGSLLVIVGVISFRIVPYSTTTTSSPIWSGLLAILTGVNGCILRRNNSNLVVGTFHLLSITTFILSATMLVLVSKAYSYFKNLQDGSVSGPHKEWCLGLIIYLLVFITFELFSIIVTVLLSWQEYWIYNRRTFFRCCSGDTAEEHNGRNSANKLENLSTEDDNSPAQNGQLPEDMGITVIDQTPIVERRNQFPFLLNHKLIFIFSVLKCINGPLLQIVGLVEILTFGILKFALPIWYGILVMSNGIIGSFMRRNASKCLVGGFCALSVSSLVVSLPMVFLYTKAFVDTNLSHYSNQSSLKGADWLTFLLLCLFVVDFISSVSSAVLSCEAYWKFCLTCSAGDCTTCLSCCECDTTPLYDKRSSTPNGIHHFKNTVAPFGEDNIGQKVATKREGMPMADTSPAHTVRDNYPHETAMPNVPALVNIFVGRSGISSYDALPNTDNQDSINNTHGHGEELPEININIRSANAFEKKED